MRLTNDLHRPNPQNQEITIQWLIKGIGWPIMLAILFVAMLWAYSKWEIAAQCIEVAAVLAACAGGYFGIHMAIGLAKDMISLYQKAENIDRNEE